MKQTKSTGISRRRLLAMAGVSAGASLLAGPPLFASQNRINPAKSEQPKMNTPAISGPTITLEGYANGAPHPEPSAYVGKFSGKYEHRTVNGGIGHNLPQEAPQAFAKAIIDGRRWLNEFCRRM